MFRMPRKRMHAFSLLEVLVAVLVLGLGVVAVSGMQLTSLRATQNSSFHTTALQLASELADTIRATRSHSSATLLSALDIHGSQLPAQPPEALCYHTDCDPSQLIVFAVYEWQKKLSLALPAARARVCADTLGSNPLTWECNSGEGASLVIKVGWHEKSGAATAESPPRIALTVAPQLP